MPLADWSEWHDREWVKHFYPDDPEPEENDETEDEEEENDDEDE